MHDGHKLPTHNPGPGTLAELHQKVLKFSITAGLKRTRIPFACETSSFSQLKTGLSWNVKAVFALLHSACSLLWVQKEKMSIKIETKHSHVVKTHLQELTFPKRSMHKTATCRVLSWGKFAAFVPCLCGSPGALAWPLCEMGCWTRQDCPDVFMPTSTAQATTYNAFPIQLPIHPKWRPFFFDIQDPLEFCSSFRWNILLRLELLHALHKPQGYPECETGLSVSTEAEILTEKSRSLLPTF